MISPEFALFYLGLCFVAGIAGRNRRIGFWGFFFCSILLTPFISLLFLYFATPRKRLATPRKA
jgi:hypothetical protein